MTIRRTLGVACAVAALVGMSGAAYAGSNNGYTRTVGKDKVEIYISVKSGAYADVDYAKQHGGSPAYGLQSVNGIYGQKPQIKEETAKAWGQVKKVKIEAQGVTSGTWDAYYDSSASTHSKSSSSGSGGGYGGGGGGYSATSTSNGGGNGGGCGCSSSSTTSASASGGTSGSWSTGGGGSGGSKK